MKLPSPIKNNNGFQDYQFSDPIFGFMMPVHFFVKPLLNFEEVKKEFNQNLHFCEKPVNIFIYKPLPARRLMKCNRVD